MPREAMACDLQNWCTIGFPYLVSSVSHTSLGGFIYPFLFPIYNPILYNAGWLCKDLQTPRIQVLSKPHKINKYLNQLNTWQPACLPFESSYKPEGWRGKVGETRTASPLVTLEDAISSRRFHAAACFSLSSSSLTLSSSYFSTHSANSSGSRSENNFCTFILRLCTAGFQCPFIFFSKAGKMIGRITLLFCLIKLSTRSLFHKNNALSAT